MAKTPPKGHGPHGHGFQRPRNTKKTFLRLLGYLGKYKLLLILVALCLLLSSIASVATGYLLKPILNDYIIPGDFPGLFGSDGNAVGPVSLYPNSEADRL